MSVWTYKKEDGKIVSELLEAHLLDAQLQAGWTVDKESLNDSITKEDADTNQSGKLSVEEIRAAAKEAGIDGWESKRIKTLEAELWPTQKAM
jgi:hypothetical protein